MFRESLRAYFLLSLSLLMTAPGYARDPDMDNGEEINELCAGCHGVYGEGGKQGEYPRIAGQPYQFLVDQLVLFRERKRPNLAMVEYVDERQMPDADIQDIGLPDTDRTAEPYVCDRRKRAWVRRAGATRRGQACDPDSTRRG